MKKAKKYYDGAVIGDSGVFELDRTRVWHSFAVSTSRTAWLLD